MWGIFRARYAYIKTNANELKYGIDAPGSEHR